ncbi:MAG: ParB/RepB/Spo0J family partition protein [Anaerolineales bacterium]|nr:ParB/RepB/Spo0J family partition protein [Anaerolineales bacterium]MCS7248139.1 ParB/RepB/Spo0J family partition protein [Anaerolineales bacterium]MDW8161951.1 ParB/RepB/Spo0J family partition protein [Anaerolineales bacterium]MDW8447432.1 ParB/RepB/Spo0J family partition protein [Anaerolineales bacterium]
MSKRTVLGRGLDALIPAGEDSQGVRFVPIERIVPNPLQPRAQIESGQLAELAQSIREHGILQPLVVSYDPEQERYVLIAGERRWLAAKQAGLSAVPVIQRQVDERTRLELALVENLQREDLDPLEAAEAYRVLIEHFHLSHEKISERVGKSRVAITNTLRLLKLPEAVKEALRQRRISEGHARALLALPSPQAQLAALQTVLQNELSVRQTEELVRKFLGRKPSSSIPRETAPEIRSLETQLSQALGTKVRLSQRKKGGGTIVIHYYSDEELEALIQRLLPHEG